jgi:hypothetical protein
LKFFGSIAAPGLTVWENLKHGEEQYVKVAAAAPAGTPASPAAMNAAVYYAVIPDSLVVTLSETVLKRALDRRKAAPSEEKWPGQNLGLKLGRSFVDVWQIATGESSANVGQLRSWGNIPILNELRRAVPEKDRQELYETYWHARLKCPGGGSYVWNEE